MEKSVAPKNWASRFQARACLGVVFEGGGGWVGAWGGGERKGVSQCDDNNLLSTDILSR